MLINDSLSWGGGVKEKDKKTSYKDLGKYYMSIVFVIFIGLKYIT